MADRATARPPAADYWPVSDFDLDDYDLSVFAATHRLYQTSAGGVYAKPEDVRSYFKDQTTRANAAVAGVPYPSPKRQRKWRNRMIKLPT